MNEKQFERLLNIQTAGFQFGYPKSIHYHRYEPTPYEALEQLFEQYELPPQAKIIDFGSGKGRVPIYLHYKFQIPAVGIEMDPKFFLEAENNRTLYLQGARKRSIPILFLNMLAEEYEVQKEDNVFFFFNPFSVQIFQRVLNNIYLSYEQHPREIHLLFYYPSPEYMSYLLMDTAFHLLKEVQLSGYHNLYERICVFILEY